MKCRKNSNFSKQKNMAYLPGERPLVCPWTNVSPSKDLPPRLSIQRNVSGPGSAYVEWGDGLSVTKLIAVVKGPRQQSTLRAIFEVEASFASFIDSNKNELASTKEIASYVKEAVEGCVDMEKYPQCAVSVFLKIIQCGSGSIHNLLCASVLATFTALREAGIATSDELVCLPISLLPNGEFQINRADPCLTIGITVKSRKIAFIHSTGLLKEPIEQVESMVNLISSSIEPFSQVIADRTS